MLPASPAAVPESNPGNDATRVGIRATVEPGPEDRVPGRIRATAHRLRRPDILEGAVDVRPPVCPEVLP